LLRRPLFSEGLDSTGGAFAGRANHKGAFATRIMIFVAASWFLHEHKNPESSVPSLLIAAIFMVCSGDVPEFRGQGAILMLRKYDH
jgi:hypothetical protein